MSYEALERSRKALYKYQSVYSKSMSSFAAWKETNTALLLSAFALRTAKVPF